MSHRSFACLLLAASIPVFGACTTDQPPEDGESAFAVSMPAADAQRLVDLVNYPGTDLAALDGAARLDARAAKAILARRNGADGVSPSADDVYFTSLASVDAISYVGDSALAKLETYANAHPAPASEAVETVVFQGWQAEAVVWGVNHASLRELDVDAGLDARAAANLVAHVPYGHVASIGTIAQVGPAALAALRGHALVWWARMKGGVTTPCDLSFTVIADADGDDLSSLTDAATTADYPYAEIVTLQIDPCVLTDQAQRARLVPALASERSVIHWAVDPTAPISTTDLAADSSSYVADIAQVADAITEHAANGWAPTDPATQALYARLPQLVDGLTAAPRANPAAYLETVMRTDADECSEYTTALINPSNGRISIVHEFPKC